MRLSEPLERWRRRGAVLRIQNFDVFTLVDGHGPTLLLLHGFPTSSYDWSAVVPALAQSHRVVLLDLPGFGLSSKPQIYSYSLLEQADVVQDVCARLGVTDAHLVAHDMGASIACELLARREEHTLPLALRSVTLMNSGVQLSMSRLTPSQRVLRRPFLGQVFARLSSRTTFKLQFRFLFGRRDAVPDDELDRLWELLRHDDGQLRLPRIIQYLDERIARAVRWQAPLTRLDLPALLLWGRRDPVAVFAIAERLHGEIPGSRLVTLDELGHYPQIEDPGRVAAAIGSFVDSVDAPAAAAAAR